MRQNTVFSTKCNKNFLWRRLSRPIPNGEADTLGHPPHTHPIDALHAEILGTPLITWYGEYCWNVVIGNLFKAER